jgi:hypothetical protein
VPQASPLEGLEDDDTVTVQVKYIRMLSQTMRCNFIAALNKIELLKIEEDYQ